MIYKNNTLHWVNAIHTHHKKLEDEVEFFKGEYCARSFNSVKVLAMHQQIKSLATPTVKWNINELMK